MRRSLSYLRRGLFGIAFVGSLGFGATVAFAKPETSGSGAKCPIGTTMCPNGYCAQPYESCFHPL
ncbi:MAG: hypothetical protein JO040_03640 [Gemmatimonadetes bacterium]|nr:hypothetical protein [Gemmatimonadota bacterium]